MDALLKYASLFGSGSALIAAMVVALTAYQVRAAIRGRHQAAFTYFPNPLNLEALENEPDETI